MNEKIGEKIKKGKWRERKGRKGGKNKLER